MKNTLEGNVEAVATGTNMQLDLSVQWCRKGTKRAVVEEVIVTKMKDTHFVYFEVIRKK